MCRPTVEGGIGVRSFEYVQKSLHMKLASRILSIDNLWTKFLKAKYFSGN